MPFPSNLTGRKNPGAGSEVVNARDFFEHPHATPASLRRSGADAPFRGFSSKCHLTISIFERNEFGARPQEPSHKRLPGERVWIPGVAPGRARTGGTSRMALFAADPLLCKQQKTDHFRRTLSPANVGADSKVAGRASFFGTHPCNTGVVGKIWCRRAAPWILVEVLLSDIFS